jgi:hypothetical protein
MYQHLFIETEEHEAAGLFEENEKRKLKNWKQVVIYSQAEVPMLYVYTVTVLSLAKYHAMKACWGSGGIAPRIL